MRPIRTARWISLTLATTAATALAADIPPKGTANDDQPSVTPQLRINNYGDNPAAIAAARTPAVAPDKLARFVPAKLDKFSRNSLEPKTTSIGPAQLSQVEAIYSGGESRGFSLLLIDSAGFPQRGTPFAEIPANGSVERRDGYERKGIEIKGHAAVIENTTDGGTLQVRVSPRLRLILQGSGLSGDAMATLVRDLDLAGIAALAPNAPPALPEIERPAARPANRE